VQTESDSAWDFEPIFVDFQTLDFRVERARWQAELRRRAAWPRDLSMTFCQRGLNHFLFLFQENAIGRSRSAEGNGPLLTQPNKRESPPSRPHVHLQMPWASLTLSLIRANAPSMFRWLQAE